MKLTSLLAQYLYTNHRLDLPGIGTFLLDPDVIAQQENSKQRTTVLDGISFESNPSVKESPELIAYISAQSGKMKALASADLESHIQLVQQFLNIGKPFLFEGIGTLTKAKAGKFEFAPLSAMPEKLKDFRPKETTSGSHEASSSRYESFLSSPKVNFGWRRPVVALLILAGIALAIWGGYTISRKAATEDTTDITTPLQEPPKDTTTTVQPELPKPGNYNKYVLQVSKKQTAMRRYAQLRTNQWDVQLETRDSILYKLYMLIPSSSDSTRVLDSLTVMTGKKVYIESQN